MLLEIVWPGVSEGVEGGGDDGVGGGEEEAEVLRGVAAMVTIDTACETWGVCVVSTTGSEEDTIVTVCINTCVCY